MLDATSERLLASVGLHRIDPRDAVGEIGYWCVENARQQGVTTEAVRAVCEWAFGGLKLARIDWYSAVGNWASRRLAEKVGFVVEGDCALDFATPRGVAMPGSGGCFLVRRPIRAQPLQSVDPSDHAAAMYDCRLAGASGNGSLGIYH